MISHFLFEFVFLFFFVSQRNKKRLLFLRHLFLCCKLLVGFHWKDVRFHWPDLSLRHSRTRSVSHKTLLDWLLKFSLFLLNCYNSCRNVIHFSWFRICLVSYTPHGGILLCEILINKWLECMVVLVIRSFGCHFLYFFFCHSLPNFGV